MGVLTRFCSISSSSPSNENRISPCKTCASVAHILHVQGKVVVIPGSLTQRYITVNITSWSGAGTPSKPREAAAARARAASCGTRYVSYGLPASTNP